MRNIVARGVIVFIPLMACTADIEEDLDAQVADERAEHQRFHPDDIQWGDAPPSFPSGAEMALLEGDPAAAGEVYTLRLRLPADYAIPPHMHPMAERATVLSGTLHLGHDENMDKETADRIEPGTYFTIPAGAIHYVISGSDGPAVLHITSVGPLQLEYVDPEDDPRAR